MRSKYYLVLIFSILILLTCNDQQPSDLVDSGPDVPESVCTDGLFRRDRCELGNLPGGQLNICNYFVSYCINGQWTECEQENQPKVEICDGLDNDCDSELDEVPARLCVPEGEPVHVYNDDDKDSDCTQGQQECADGRWDTCRGYTGPQQETCDDRDNDCDGVIDNNPRGLGVCGYRYDNAYRGICAETGESICYEGEILCVGATQPSAAELCNNLDDDCDGITDEDTYFPCDNGCGPGLEMCQQGIWSHCSAPSCFCQPGTEAPCKAMPCGQGTRICGNDSTWGPCLDPESVPEECNNHDDDCNNLIDDDPSTLSGYLEQWCYDGYPPETEGIGECHGAIQVCSEGFWPSCIGQVIPQQEICNRLDDDCDGSTDEIREEGKFYDIVIAVDRSASTNGEIHQIIASVEDFASLSGELNSWALIVFGQDNFSGRPYLAYNLAQVSGFLIELTKVLDVREGSIEPSLDLIYDVLSSDSGFGLSWRDIASPVLIVFTDEEQQTIRGTDITDILPLLEVCQLPGCYNPPNSFWENRDPFNYIYLFVTSPYSPWQTLLQYVEDDMYMHIFDIEDDVAINLESLLRTICVVQGD